MTKIERHLLNELKKRIEKKKGIGVFVKHKAKFEGWLKVEVCDILTNLNKNVIPERKWVDITFEDWGIELKTVNTNYRTPTAMNKNRPITKNIESIISDIAKLRCIRSYKHKRVLFIVFPLDKNENWIKHMQKISGCNTQLVDIDVKFANGSSGKIYLGKIN